MKIYIAGKINGDPGYKEKFRGACSRLLADGHQVMNPAILPGGFAYEEYMNVCFAMMDVCDAVYLLDDWPESPGARREMEHARETNKVVMKESWLPKDQVAEQEIRGVTV